MAAVGRSTRRRPAALLVRLLTVVWASMLLAVAAGPAAADTDIAPPPPGEPWFGPQLEWSTDLPADYADRLGTTPSLYEQRIDYPLDGADETFLEQFAEQAATQGAVALLTVEPRGGLDLIEASDAADLAARIADLSRDYDTSFLLRYAPEMNGSWRSWGQQPAAYVATFRSLADAVHDATDRAAMVWAPSYGAGYPFAGADRAIAPSGAVGVEELDTDGDGEVTELDDPYAPYFPGEEYVDWVGLSIYSFDEGQAESDYYAGALAETSGYTRTLDRTPFYDTYAERPDRPMLIDTAAVYLPSDTSGDSELDVKQAWWQQVLAANADHPQIAAVAWLEQVRDEPEVGGLEVDWRATSTEQLAAALLADLRDSEVTLGPVTRVLDQDAANRAAVQVRYLDEADAGSELGWITLCVVVAAILFLLAGAAGRFLPSWRFVDDGSSRDARLDLFRGFIIITVVVTHIEVNSPYSFLSLRAIGAISGAEMFVLLSGVVLGMVYAPTVRRVGEWGAAVGMLRRARKQYLVALAVVVLVYLLALVPFIDADDITTFTDRGTGEAGSGATGQVYSLYANAERLFDYPPPQYAVQQLLLLEMGPWVFNIMGLFVVLSLLVPLMMFLVRRGYWWVLLSLSWAVYVLGAVTDISLFPSQFEAVFPLFLWQLPFTHGLVLGHYRREVTAALLSTRGKVAVTVFVVGYAVVLGYLWLGQSVGFTPVPFGAGTYDYLSANAYTRVVLQPGRLVDLALVIVVAYAVLTTCWKPINAAIGWLWIPMGRASLYVFIVHVFFALAVANLPGLDRSDFWAGLVIHTVVVLAIWALVKRRVLFSVIPQ